MPTGALHLSTSTALSSARYTTSLGALMWRDVREETMIKIYVKATESDYPTFHPA